LWSSLISALLQAGLLSWWMLRRVGLRFSKDLLGQMIRFGLPLILSNTALFTLNFSDRFFLRHSASLDAVGIYAVGYKFGFVINYLIVQPFLVMWQARMFIIHKSPDHPAIFGQIFAIYANVLIYAALAVALLSPELVYYMVDPRFAASREVIPIVTASYVFWGLGYFAQLGMFVTDKTGWIGVTSLGAACLNLGLNYVLIGRYGMLGAAWATFLSFLVIAAVNYVISQQLLPLPLGLGRVAMSTALAASVYLVFAMWSRTPDVPLLLVKACVLCAFPMALWKMRILSSAEVGTLVSAADAAFNRLTRMLGIRYKGAVEL
jgi:O-antigen/teichoic acid export membrane protein